MDLAAGTNSGPSSLADGASRPRSNPNGKAQNKTKTMLETTFLTITGKIINLHARHNTLFVVPDAAKFCFSDKEARRNSDPGLRAATLLNGTSAETG
jgi:hypothetical protein